MATQRPLHAKQAPPSQIRLIYLTSYNLVFASLWASIFIRATSHALTSSRIDLFRATEPHARWIQTASLIEVLHAACGNLLFFLLLSQFIFWLDQTKLNQINPQFRLKRTPKLTRRNQALLNPPSALLPCKSSRA